MALHPRLPPEIFASICDEVAEAEALALLCRTSRLFQNQAQRMLYHTVDLQARGMRSVKSWSLAVIRHSHLAERVHTLSLLLPANLEPTDAAKIKHALSRCVNLKELTLSGRRPDSIYGWMINECTFRLTKFANSYFESRWIEDFWASQSTIRVLSYSHYSFPCSDEQLPNLIAVKSTQLSGLPARRPLQRIETIGFQHHLDYSHLEQYRGTLTTLNLLRERVDWEATLARTLIVIADFVPALLHLGIVEVRKDDFAQIELTPTEALQKFPRIETFILHVRTVTQFKDPNSDRIYEMDTAADLEALGLEIMATCPTLRRTAMGAEAVLDHELSCVLTKSPGDGIHSEVGTNFDFDAVSMFWNP
ncbi:hypothetical protein C8R44DRAFT_241318 [Mycena epipterygia]|nr:hypothetical protein C8R44DRAFT_241318 [Mycena epipterygia]